MSESGKFHYDAVIVGAGPNGLSAAAELARHGARVLVVEARDTVGGGARTAELTLPGFRHDVCSAVHPLAVGSPVFRSLPLERYGLKWIHPELPLAHPLDGGEAVGVWRSIERTAAGMGSDGAAYRQLIAPLVNAIEPILSSVLGPLRPNRRVFTLARFGISAVRSAEGLAYQRFGLAGTRALFAGVAGHSMIPLDRPGSAAFGIVLLIAAHAYGWPVASGGSQAIANALADYIRNLGGEIQTGTLVRSLRELPRARSYLFDVSPSQLVEICDERIQGIYRKQLESYRYGPGVFKIDYALSAPIPWTAEICRRAGTVHVGGTFEEIAASEMAVWEGRHARRPLVLVAQQSLFDPSRAPGDRHTAWAYCHVPNGSTRDMSSEIERQIERLAPGFQSAVLARHTRTAREYEDYNPNFLGGDIGTGANVVRQMITRPVARLDPYSTPDPQIFLCSAATPPGGGVHGMCGYGAARSVLRRWGMTRA